MIARETPGARPLEHLFVEMGYSALGGDFVELRDPSPGPAPYLVAFNPEVAALLDLAPHEGTRPEFLQLAAGNARFTNVPSFAAAYAGHQFGAFVPQLGDGRAITLGEIANARGERWEWQLKGAGMTAFSRFGDGRAVLRSTIREYLASEALFHLGIPTTRALAIAGSDAPVYRESAETAAVLSRIAPSHVRFGTFEFFHYRRKHDDLRTLADYTIRRFYPQLTGVAEPRCYLDFFIEVVERTARLVAQWQAAGFAHGVLNTDNMSVLGLTLDYGPYGFLDAYDPGFICNHSDEGGRYSFERQPTIGLWNCRALAAALGSLATPEAFVEALAAYEPAYRTAFLREMRTKLGLRVERDEDVKLLIALFDMMEDAGADYSGTFRALSHAGAGVSPDDEEFTKPFREPEAAADWLRRLRARLVDERDGDAERRCAMLAKNPKFVLRNHLVQHAIEEAQRGSYAEIERLHALVRAPFDEHPGREAYAGPPPPGAPSVEVSCSS
ncbi:MAG: YdiU family protein [Candidatus Eremiobacteraeota bacterium]|nr:YdiU family protein [Candidatus Eremiobacteraeota bacterium]